MYLAKIKVSKKKEIKNPEVQTLQRLLDRENLALRCKSSSILYEFEIDSKNLEEANEIIQKIAQDFLYNPIVEEYQVELCEQE